VKPSWFELQHGAASVVAERLQAGEPVPEPAFDRFPLPRLRQVAALHWTPLAVTQRVARWIEELGIESVVDLGSGAGKFCVATAVAAPRCRFVGIEQRPWLADAARDLAQVFGVSDRVQFITGALGETPIPPAAAYYLFNPFGENLFGADSHIDDEVELNATRYQRDITTVAQLLARQPPGVFVIKYNGYGGKMPRGYEVVRRDVEQRDLLRVWRRE
jgi:predicted RNA methylase